MKRQTKEEIKVQPDKSDEPSKLLMLGIIFIIFIIVGTVVFIAAKPCIPCSFDLLKQVQELKNK